MKILYKYTQYILLAEKTFLKTLLTLFGSCAGRLSRYAEVFLYVFRNVCRVLYWIDMVNIAG